MAQTHAHRDMKIKKFADLRKGRLLGSRSFVVPKEAYPEMARMDDDGYLKSEIGKRFGVTGQTAGRIIRAYRGSL